MPEYVYLSFPLGLRDPRPPAIPAPELAPLYTIAGDGASVHTLKVATKHGTTVTLPLDPERQDSADYEARP